jgi:hypothetical protein
VGREINQLLGRIFAQRHKDGRTDLEAIETAVRSTVHQAGAAALTELLQFPAPAVAPRTRPCSCGRSAHYGGLRSQPVLTVVGRVEVSRPYYLCPDCHAGQFPADVELDIENTEFSPGVRRMQALVGQEAPFDHGREQMKVLAGLEVTAKSVERTAEAIGADIAQREPTPSALPLNLPGAVETAEEFGPRLYREAGKRGWSRALMRVVMGDGAEWIWHLAALHFPGAIEIVDLYHARQPLWDLARRLFPNDEGKQKAWMKLHQKRLLDKGKIEKLVGVLRAIRSTNSELAEKIRTAADYFERNAERMRYPQFRRLHLFVGSGVIEAGCKTVVASRLKRSGMFWTVRGANAILALRCACLNGRFEDYWEDRRTAIAA